MFLVVEKWAVNTQREFTHGRKLAQNVIDLDFHARVGAYGFSGVRQHSKLSHINSIGMVGCLIF